MTVAPQAHRVEPASLAAPAAGPTVAVVGNPNTGKTTLFNLLTGLRQHTGNYAGVTVETKLGQIRLGDRRVNLVDLPGTYSLAARSADEMAVADVLLGHGARQKAPPDAVLLVADATNLERNLFLASQVIECGRPLVVALNMMDIARARGLEIDLPALSREIGCRVVPIVASKGTGVEELRAALAEAIDHPPADPPKTVALPPPVELAIAELLELFNSPAGQARLGRPLGRVEAMRVLIDRRSPGERRMVELFGQPLRDRLEEMRLKLAIDELALVTIEPAARYAHIEGVIARCVHKRRGEETTLSDRLDAVLTSRYLGTAIFLAVMAVMFQAIYVGAAPLMDGIDATFGWLGQWVAGRMAPGALQSLICDGLIAGVGAVLVFLPQIVILFAFIAVLEDCGYMSRAAFLLDRTMSRCGLSGRSFVPLLSSFACAVPGIMAARTIENRRDRLATILIAPLMSCSGRLPVYALLIGAFIPETRWLGGAISLQGLTLLALYLLGIVAAIATAHLLKRTLLRGGAPAFMMEMPSYKRPNLRAVAMRLYEGGTSFLLRAGTVVVAATVVIWALTYYPRPSAIAERFDQRRQQASQTLSGDALAGELDRLDREQAGAYVRQSYLGQAGRALEPAVRPLGWDWRIGTATLASFPAREIVVSSLGAIYNVGDDPENSGQLRVVLQNSRETDGRLSFPPLVGVSLLVFIALSCQCSATLAAIRREAGGWRWSVLTFVYMTGLAYLAAMAVFQGGRLLGWA